ncbi:MAG TPA: extracellular solute-binding protein, partial [Halanaerobiales bacterium]|nr:extracellular solute-binding protein [Halanaerobiales bacterium]
MKKFLIIFLMVLIFSLTAVAMAEEEVTLSFWSWRTEDIDAYEYFISEFNKEHPNIKINFEPYKNTEYNTILATALQGGSGPDIIHLRAYGGMEDLANAGYLTPLDGKVTEFENFPQDILAGATNRRDERVYGVPFAVQYVQVLYNKELFNQLGLEIPETWDEFLNVARKAKDAGYFAFANGTKEGWTNETLFGGIAPTFYGGNDFYYEVVDGTTTFEDPR